MNEQTLYHYYDKLINQLHNEHLVYGQDYLRNDTYQKIEDIKSRLIEIYSIIRDDYSISLDDPQYESTTSWQFENEIKKLLDEKSTLIEKFESEKILLEKLEHQKNLKEAGLTEQEYQSLIKPKRKNRT